MIGATSLHKCRQLLGCVVAGRKVRNICLQVRQKAGGGLLEGRLAAPLL